MMVRLAMMIACAEGAEAIGGLMEALEESGNSQLVSDFRVWIKEDFATKFESKGEPKEDGSAAQTEKPEDLAAQTRNVNETSSCGAKLVDKIMTQIEDDFMGQLEGHLVSKAVEVVNIPDFCSSLAIQQVLDENDMQLATGREIQDEQQVKKVIKAACLKRKIGSLVVAFQKSNNERILAGTYDWLKTPQARKKNYPIPVKSLAAQPSRVLSHNVTYQGSTNKITEPDYAPMAAGPYATGIFAATSKGLNSLDLRTLEAIALTSVDTSAVAVNYKLNKVYWSEVGGNSSIMRSNFDGSAKEEVVPQTSTLIFMLAIDQPSGNVYFARESSNEITICNELGQNRAAVISNSRLVNNPVAMALDSDNGFMYWGNRVKGRYSLVRAKLDGSNPTTVSNGFNSLLGITLNETSNGVLYWADCCQNAIGSIDVNGGNKRTLVQLERYPGPGPFGIQVDAHKIYFANRNCKSIQSVDKDSGEELTTIFNSTGELYHLALFSVPA